MMTTPGNTLAAPVREAGDLVLYLASRALDGLPAQLKVPSGPRPSPVLSRRLEHEYELSRLWAS